MEKNFEDENIQFKIGDFPDQEKERERGWNSRGPAGDHDID